MVIWITAAGRWKGLGEEWKRVSCGEFEIRCCSENDRCGNWELSKRKKLEISLELSVWFQCLQKYSKPMQVWRWLSLPQACESRGFQALLLLVRAVLTAAVWGCINAQIILAYICCIFSFFKNHIYFTEYKLFWDGECFSLCQCLSSNPIVTGWKQELQTTC